MVDQERLKGSPYQLFEKVRLVELNYLQLFLRLTCRLQLFQQVCCTLKVGLKLQGPFAVLYGCRLVTLARGRPDDPEAEVLSGLAEGERVALPGA